ncbi:SRPBCC family protein [Azospirillum sp. ST 5-10]|uniref:SRPBCC family protein n=1 Tax=unclassified Azospirillum TaxID=2630922 RepID=UPI003F4A28DB
MPTRLLAIAATLLMLASPAAAHGPTPRKAEESVVIAASPDAVWAVVSAFPDIAAWHPMITASAADPQAGAGTTRTLTLDNGGQLVESLDEMDAAGKRLSYRLLKENVEAFPVSFYSAILTVSAAPEGGSRVVWSGRFYRGDTGNYPPETLDDAAAEAAMTRFFRSGLDGLKASVERKS